MIRLFKHYIPHAVLLLGLFDLALLFTAAEVAWRLRAEQIGMAVGEIGNRLWPHFGFADMMLTAMISVGVYGADSLRFIRKVRNDELPQTWSVLKGEMSFVGPRPERPEFVSGLEDQLPYYAKNYTPFLDLLNLLQTLRFVLWHEGAR